jgi:hypothetical protein
MQEENSDSFEKEDHQHFDWAIIPGIEALCLHGFPRPAGPSSDFE